MAQRRYWEIHGAEDPPVLSGDSEEEAEEEAALEEEGHTMGVGGVGLTVGILSEIQSEVCSNDFLAAHVDTILPLHLVEALHAARAADQNRGGSTHGTGTMVEAAVATVMLGTGSGEGEGEEVGGEKSAEVALAELADWMVGMVAAEVDLEGGGKGWAAQFNPKGALLEKGGQVEATPLPDYPNHAPMFRAVARLGGVEATRDGKRKIDAEAAAAWAILEEEEEEEVEEEEEEAAEAEDGAESVGAEGERVEAEVQSSTRVRVERKGIRDDPKNMTMEEMQKAIEAMKQDTESMRRRNVRVRKGRDVYESNPKGSLLEMRGTVESSRLPGSPDHAPMFRAIACWGDTEATRDGRRKKEAEAEAARAVLDAIYKVQSN